ncbi:response regulator [Allomuricauda sp. d1]|uniref:response regulator n=1 Tax=Allomuricauda sp. d1 TaxID=3136725 RepID=UPI0031DD3529
MKKKIKTTWVIDDDEIYLFWTTKMIRELELSENILVYHDGQQAIEELKAINTAGEKFPEVILLDINMPIMNGWDFLEEFVKIPHQNDTKVLVYVVSSSIAQEDLERAKQFDVVHNYILKPLTVEQLKEVMAVVV